MVNNKWFGEDKRKKFRLDRQSLAKRQPLGIPQAKKYTSVKEPTASYYSRLRRIMVSYDTKKKIIHGTLLLQRQRYPEMALIWNKPWTVQEGLVHWGGVMPEYSNIIRGHRQSWWGGSGWHTVTAKNDQKDARHGLAASSKVQKVTVDKEYPRHHTPEEMPRLCAKVHTNLCLVQSRSIMLIISYYLLC